MKEDMKYYLSNLAAIKNFIWPILVFFAPIQGILITVGGFIALDTATGVWKSKKNDIPITSKKLSKVISKMVLYNSCVLLSYLLDYYVIGDILEKLFSIEGLMVKVVALLLIFIESKSINENYYAAKGVNLWSEFKKLLSRGQEISQDISHIKKPKKQFREDQDAP